MAGVPNKCFSYLLGWEETQGEHANSTQRFNVISGAIILPEIDLTHL